MDQENIELKQSPGFSTPKYNKEISNSATATPVKINALKRKSSDNNIVSENENSNVKRIKRQPFGLIQNNVDILKKEEEYLKTSKKISYIQANSYENNYEMTSDESIGPDVKNNSQEAEISTPCLQIQENLFSMFESETDSINNFNSNQSEVAEQVNIEKFKESNIVHQTDENNNDESTTNGFYTTALVQETYRIKSDDETNNPDEYVTPKESFDNNQDDSNATCKAVKSNCEAQTQIEPYISNQDDNTNKSNDNQTEVYLTEIYESKTKPNNSENQADEFNNDQVNEYVTESTPKSFSTINQQVNQNVSNKIKAKLSPVLTNEETSQDEPNIENKSELYTDIQADVNNNDQIGKYLFENKNVWNQYNTDTAAIIEETFRNKSLPENSNTIVQIEEYVTETKGESAFRNKHFGYETTNIVIETYQDENKNESFKETHHQFSPVEQSNLPENNYYEENSIALPLIENIQSNYVVNTNQISRSHSNYEVNLLLNMNRETNQDNIIQNTNANNDETYEENTYEDYETEPNIKINVVAGPSTSTKQQRAKREKSPSSEIIDFALRKILEIFTADEIRTGVFPDKKNRTASKTREVFDLDKTINLKSAIAEEFDFDEDSIENEWAHIRSKLNIRVSALSKQVRFKKHFGID